MRTRDQQAQERAPDGAGAPQRRRLDPEASEIGFGVRKMGLYTVKGRFRARGGEMRVDEQERPVSAEVVLDAASVSTRMPPRDLHLRSNQFLAVKAHPEMRSCADEIAADDDGMLRVPAEVTIRGVTKRVELRAHRHDDGGRQVLHVTGRLDRHAFGIRPPMPFEWIVGQHVDLNALLVFVR